MSIEPGSEPAGEPTIVRRDIALDVDRDAAWDLIGDADGWARWLVDEAAVDVTAGEGGTVRDAGVEREVVVTDVDRGRAVEFVWWTPGRPATASSVSLAIDDDGDGGVVLRVVESFPPRSARLAASAALRWEVRAVATWLAGRARVVV